MDCFSFLTVFEWAHILTLLKRHSCLSIFIYIHRKLKYWERERNIIRVQISSFVCEKGDVEAEFQGLPVLEENIQDKGSWAASRC